MKYLYLVLVPWVVVSLFILTWGLLAPTPEDVKDAHAGMAFWMLLLSFPVGLLVFFAADGYFSIANHPESYILAWSSFFVAGLVQWTVIIRLVVKLLTKLAPNNAFQPTATASLRSTVAALASLGAAEPER